MVTTGPYTLAHERAIQGPQWIDLQLDRSRGSRAGGVQGELRKSAEGVDSGSDQGKRSLGAIYGG